MEMYRTYYPGPIEPDTEYLKLLSTESIQPRHLSSPASVRESLASKSP